MPCSPCWGSDRVWVWFWICGCYGWKDASPSNAMRGVGATRVSRFMGTGKKVTPSTQAAIELKPVPGLFAITRVMRQMQIARPELFSFLWSSCGQTGAGAGTGTGPGALPAYWGKSSQNSSRSQSTVFPPSYSPSLSLSPSGQRVSKAANSPPTVQINTKVGTIFVYAKESTTNRPTTVMLIRLYLPACVHVLLFPSLRTISQMQKLVSKLNSALIR